MTKGAQIGGSAAAQDAAGDWQALRESGDIQFAPLPPIEPPRPPDWLRVLGEWLRWIFEPLGEALGVSWPVIEKGLIAVAALIVLYLAWRLALLEDADRLAAEGRYGEATHLLLQRSVRHIAKARPEWLLPASTAREIAAFPLLPERARRAFAEIAVRVERSLFALRDLDAADWQAARAAYAEFALQSFAPEAPA